GRVSRGPVPGRAVLRGLPARPGRPDDRGGAMPIATVPVSTGSSWRGGGGRGPRRRAGGKKPAVSSRATDRRRERERGSDAVVVAREAGACLAASRRSRPAAAEGRWQDRVESPDMKIARVKGREHTVGENGSP